MLRLKNAGTIMAILMIIVLSRAQKTSPNEVGRHDRGETRDCLFVDKEALMAFTS